jgi:hypothetical protein
MSLMRGLRRWLVRLLLVASAVVNLACRTQSFRRPVNHTRIGAP